MSDVVDFKTVIERRKGPLSHVLQQRVSKTLFSYELSKVCEEIGDSSCLGRNWKKMATFLIKPDRFTMDKLSKSEDKGFEVLSKWLEVNEEGTFDELLQAMVECEVYSAADELLNYLERLDDDNEESTMGKKPFLTEDEKIVCEVDDPSEKPPEASSHVRKESIEHVKKPPYQRSISWPRQIFERSRKLFRRSKSCQDSQPNNESSLPTEPKIKQDILFIVSSKEDSETPPMKNFLSFVEKIERVKNGELHVITIHDWSGGLMATAWLEEQVERAVYVLICFSEKVKEIFAHGQEFESQSDCNLKFTLDFLVTGQLWRNMCYNRGGKFLPILLPGNLPSCIMQCLLMFRAYNWPNEQKSIKNYLLNLPDRQPPPLGERKPLMSKQLPTQTVA